MELTANEFNCNPTELRVELRYPIACKLKPIQPMKVKSFLNEVKLKDS